MKRFTVLLILIAVFTVALSAPVRASAVYAAPTYAAQTEYARASYARSQNKSAYFFTEKDSKTALFAVPYTYCVEVLRDDGDWYYVRYGADSGIYKALYGFCKKTDFKLEDTTPQVTFLYKTVTVKYSAENKVPSLPVLSEIALEAAYYGTYDAGATVYSYVYCQGSFGYIEGANDDYPLNTPDTDPSDDKKDDGGGEKKQGLSFATIAFIVIAVLFAVVVLVIYFVTRKPKTDT